MALWNQKHALFHREINEMSAFPVSILPDNKCWIVHALVSIEEASK